MKKLALLALLPVMLFTAACDSLIETSPRQSADPDVALQSFSSFEALLVGAYDRLQQIDRYGQHFLLYPDALADNLTHTTPHSNRYPNVSNNAHGVHLTTWTNPYGAINDVNIILARIDAFQDPTIADLEARKNRVRAEARFLRALNYFDLVRTKAYEPGREVNGWDQGVVLRLEPTDDVAQAQYRPRATNREVYAAIEADLIAAAELFQNAHRRPGEQVRWATRASSLALLARVYLYQSKWQEAADAATAARAATSASLVQDTGGDELRGAWARPSHPESLFELNMTSGRDGDATTVNGALQALTYGPCSALEQAFSFEAIPTTDLWNAHEANDARRRLYDIGCKLGPGNPQVRYIRKYTGTISTNVDRIPVIRLPELYLIRAEARAELGQDGDARDDLNEVRNSRNLPDVAEETAGPALIAAIMRERRVEFAFEGHRFFDLKRRGMDIPKPQLAAGSIAYTNYRILSPLPTSEVNASRPAVDQAPVLQQNPGY